MRSCCAQLAQGAHLIVIGAGWIGLEVAATARKRGASVTVIEPLPRICARAAPPEISEHLLHLHERQGVGVSDLGVGVAAVEDTAEAVAVTLTDGTSVRGDAAVARNWDRAQRRSRASSGAKNRQRNYRGRAHANVGPMRVRGGRRGERRLVLGARVRLKSLGECAEPGHCRGQGGAGKEAHYDELPWFWSDQYNLNLQMLGVPARWSEPVVRGALNSESFSVFYLEGENLVGVVAANAPRDLRAAKRLMQQRKPVCAEQLNPAINLAKL